MNRNYAIPRQEVAGYEVVERYDDPHGVSATIRLWKGDHLAGRILDRVTGTPVQRQCIATVSPQADGSGYTYNLHAGAKGGWRYGYARTYDAALKAIDAWTRRRLTRRAS